MTGGRFDGTLNASHRRSAAICQWNPTRPIELTFDDVNLTGAKIKGKLLI